MQRQSEVTNDDDDGEDFGGEGDDDEEEEMEEKGLSVRLEMKYLSSKLPIFVMVSVLGAVWQIQIEIRYIRCSTHPCVCQTHQMIKNVKLRGHILDWAPPHVMPHHHQPGRKLYCTNEPIYIVSNPGHV